MQKSILFTATSALVIAAAPAPAPAPKPLAHFALDAATRSGMGQAVRHDLELLLTGKNAPVSPEAVHAVPAGLGVGPTLPLIGTAPGGTNWAGNPTGGMKGRILTYWGCGEQAGPGQPKIMDLAAFERDPRMKAAISRAQSDVSRATGDRIARWPNIRNSLPLKRNSSLIGAHRVTSAYTPEIAFTLAQDFMPDLALRSDPPMASGAVPAVWTGAAAATGYYLTYAGAKSGSDDMVIWFSSTSNTPGTTDYQSPDEVKKRIAGGTALAPSTTRCIIPAEVAKAVPVGALMMVGYGPYVGFSDKPKAPSWTVLARFKADSTTMLGMPDMGSMLGRADDGNVPPEPASSDRPKKKKRFGLGDVLKGVSPIAVP